MLTISMHEKYHFKFCSNNRCYHDALEFCNSRSVCQIETSCLFLMPDRTFGRLTTKTKNDNHVARCAGSFYEKSETHYLT